jgi:hypothetical protein
VHPDKTPHSATYRRIKEASGIMPAILKKVYKKSRKCSNIKIEKGIFLCGKTFFSSRIIQIRITFQPARIFSLFRETSSSVCPNIFEGTIIPSLDIFIKDKF